MSKTSAKGPETVQTAMAGTAAMMTAQTEQAITMAKASFEQVANKSREAMAQNLKTVDVITEMTRGNFDALLESSRVASGGFQVIAQDVAAFSKHSMERTAAAAKSLSQAKTAPELMQLQGEFARAEFGTAIAEMTKLSQAMFTTMTAVFEPLQKQAVIAAQIKDVLKDS
jgi:hypothetical protein